MPARISADGGDGRPSRPHAYLTYGQLMAADAWRDRHEASATTFGAALAMLNRS
jgi:hypothetical protein